MTMMTDVRRMDEQVLRDLANRPVSAPCVSFYLPPTRGSIGRQAATDTLKALRHEAAIDLAGPPWGLSEPAIAELLDRAVTQLSSTAREPFEGLACFVDADACQVVVVPNPVPATVTVAAEPDLLLLAVALRSQFEFDLLILSQRHVQLFRCDANQLEPTTRYDLPASRDAALSLDLDESNAGPRDRGATYKEERKDATERFVQIVERRLPPAVREGHRPLVVAAVDFEAAVFAKASNHPKLVKLTELGSPEHLAPSKVHAAAVALIERDVDAALASIRDRYFELDGTGRTVHDPEALHEAAGEGRIDTLLVAPEAVPGAVSLALVRATLAAGGRVVAVSPATDGDPLVAAILRY